MKRPEFILFDYGETLVHEISIDLQRGNDRVLFLAKTNPCRVGAEEFRAKANEIGAKIREIQRRENIEISIEVFHRILCGRYRLTYDISEERLAEEFWDAAFQNEPVPFAEEVLRALLARKIPYGVVSNISLSGAVLARVIQKVLPEFRAEFVLTSSDCLWRKPEPALMELSLAMTAAPRDRIWFVGDKPHRDILGAQCVGVTPVLYDAEKNYPDAEVTRITSLVQLLSLIDNAE